MDALLRDARIGLRTLARTPGFTTVAILALALGIGANTAIFTVVDTLLLRPLPYPDSDRILILAERSPKLDDMSVSYPNYLDWKAQNQVFEALGARQGDNFNLTGIDRPERLRGSNVSSEFFSALGIRPALGRTFNPEDDSPNGAKVIVISHGLWADRFQSDPRVLGRTLTLNGEGHEIIGVMPAAFRFPVTTQGDQVWLPLGRKAGQAAVKDRGNHPGIYVIGRLKPGVPLDRARADLERIAVALEREYPETNGGHRISVEPLRERTVQGIRTAALVLLGAVGFVLLIACANVANLLLARSAGRAQELSIRTALGARRRDIFRQVLVESLLLSVAGGIAGVAVAYWGVDVLRSFLPAGSPRFDEIRVDLRVLAYCFGLTLATGLLFGMAPALHAARASISDTVKEAAGRTTEGVSRHRLRHALIVAEVALSLVLLAGAGLMIQSFYRLTSTSPGFNPKNLLTAQVVLRGDEYQFGDRYVRDRPSIVRFQRHVLANISALPGVENAAAILPLPLTGDGWQTSVVREGQLLRRENAISVDYARVTPGYFATVSQPLRRGRYFTPEDDINAKPVAIIDETFAERHFAGEDPLGKRLLMGDPKEPWTLEIVGVVGHVKNYGVNAESRIEMYLAFEQFPVPSMYLVARTGHQPEALSSALRDAVARVDKDQPLFGLASMEEQIAGSNATERLSAFLLSLFAGLALVLAAIGVYGVISYSVAQRTHEIGIRMALGAERSDVLAMVLRNGAMLAGLGVVIGLACALALTRLMSSLLFGIGATDLRTFTLVALVLGAVTLLAALVPARRAAKVDPMVALRYE